jgi:chromosome segregation ATPase
MRLFKKEAPQFGADDVKATQDVVEAITAALKTGAEQQDIAAKRLGSLTKAMGKMDANVRQATRLQSEVTRLEEEAKTIRGDLDKKRAWAQEQSAKLANVQKERDKLRNDLEGSKSEVSARTEREAGLRETEMKLRRDAEILTRELNQRTDRLEDLVLTQQRLQDELGQAKGAVSSHAHKARELENAVEELTARLDEKTKSADASLSALRDLRLDHHAVKEQYVSANSRLQSTEYEQSSQKTLFEDTLKRRADEILALKTQIEQLTTQLRIKDTMGSHFDEETAGLRQALETERERNSVNEQRLRNQAETESRQSRALGQAKSEFEVLNAKFVDAMKDLDALRQVNRVQSQKLENYAQLNSAPAPKRDYAPVVRNEDVGLLKVVK